MEISAYQLKCETSQYLILFGNDLILLCKNYQRFNIAQVGFKTLQSIWSRPSNSIGFCGFFSNFLRFSKFSSLFFPFFKFFKAWVILEILQCYGQTEAGSHGAWSTYCLFMLNSNGRPGISSLQVCNLLTEIILLHDFSLNGKVKAFNIMTNFDFIQSLKVLNIRFASAYEKVIESFSMMKSCRMSFNFDDRLNTLLISRILSIAWPA